MLGSDHRHAGREVYEWITRILRRRGSRKEGFHSGNGSEFMNGTVSGLLKKLLIEQTKSRPRKSNGNGLVIRKHMWCGYIAVAYLNFHRRWGQPELITDSRGKRKYV